MSGADAWVAIDSPAAGGATADAALYFEIGVADTFETTGSTVPAAAAGFAEAGKGS